MDCISVLQISNTNLQRSHYGAENYFAINLFIGGPRDLFCSLFSTNPWNSMRREVHWYPASVLIGIPHISIRHFTVIQNIQIDSGFPWWQNGNTNSLTKVETPRHSSSLPDLLGTNDHWQTFNSKLPFGVGGIS